MNVDYQLLRKSFEAGTLEGGAFRHIDHVGVAYEMLRSNDFLETAVKFSINAQAIAEKAGAPEKFSVTITLAFLSVIAERMAAKSHSNFEEFIAQNPDLESGKLLEGWYTSQRLESKTSRQVFLLPDLLPAA